MLLSVGHGRHVPGPALVALSADLSLRPALVALGRPAIRDPQGHAIAAISISRPEPHTDETLALDALHNTARELKLALFSQSQLT
jgi:hypothetical protein